MNTKFIQETVLNYFLYLISFDTKSNFTSDEFPSTQSQKDFAEILAEKCQMIGLSDIKIDDNFYVTATLKSNIDKDVPTVGFLAHMDTSPEFKGSGIKPNIIQKYDGEDIILKNNVVISKNEFKGLENYIGETIITADGTTLLGADDKAGIAEILTAFKYISENDDIKHGDIKLAFTPDEEVGRGVDFFDVKNFGCDFGYTIDGGKIGEFSYENFYASRAKVEILGKNIHPGYAKDIMINASVVANELISSLPNETPANTCGYEGFFHLVEIIGNVEKASLDFIIRDFDKEKSIERKKTLQRIVDNINEKYNNCIKLTIKDEYDNMMEILKDRKDVVDIAVNAIREAGIEPIIKPIRGGTDGCRLSFMGLPCPNIFAGGHNFHGPYEFIPLNSMVKACEVIINIAKDIVKIN